jgi:hypothetical protein
MPTEGDATSQEAEDLFTFSLQSASAADGNGTPADVSGLAGTQTLELVNTGTGTATITIEGSYDGSTWYACGYAQMDAQATLTRSVSAISVTASPFAHTYAILDQYSRIRARQSASAGAPSITATLRALPV